MNPKIETVSMSSLKETIPDAFSIFCQILQLTSAPSSSSIFDRTYTEPTPLTFMVSGSRNKFDKQCFTGKLI